MEPNANRIFQHTDRDGDRIEVIQATQKRLTFLVWGAERQSHRRYIYLPRVEAEALRDALSAWLGDEVAAETVQCVRCSHSPRDHRGPGTCIANRNLCGCELSEFESADPGWATPTERREHWCGHGDDHGPHEHGADMRCLGVSGDLYGGPEETELPHTETCARVLLPRSDADCDCGYVKTQTTLTAEHRARALDAVSRFAPSGASSASLLDAADDVAYWLATGERAVLPRGPLSFIDAAPASDPVGPCPHCSHAFHGNVGCGEGGRGTYRCHCNGLPR